MKKRLFFVVFLLSICYATIALATDEGFRKLPWKTSLDSALKIYPDLFAKGKTSDDDFIYARTQEDNIISDVSFNHIIYIFNKNKEFIAMFADRILPRKNPGEKESFDEFNAQTKIHKSFNDLKQNIEAKYGVPASYIEKKKSFVYDNMKEAIWIQGKLRITLWLAQNEDAFASDEKKKQDALRLRIQFIDSGANLGF